MTTPPPPWRPSDFTEPCETCGAPPSQLCRPQCDTGYTAEDYRHDAEHRHQTTPEQPHHPGGRPPAARKSEDPLCHRI